MKTKNIFLPQVARRVAFGAAAVLFAASSLIFTGCKKDNAPEPTPGIEAPALKSFADRELSSGTVGGFFWQNFITTGTSNITQGAAGNFADTYSNVGDVVVGKGFNPGSTGTRGYNVGVLSG